MLPAVVQAAMRGDPDIWIVGGAVVRSMLGIDVSRDIDVFVHSKEAYDRICTALAASEFSRLGRIASSDYVDSERTVWQLQQGIKLDLICSDYAEVRGFLRSFDFSICQCAYNGESLLLEPACVEALVKRKLVQVNYHEGTTRERIEKYKAFMSATFGVYYTVHLLPPIRQEYWGY
jgi:hypothetical protein